MYKKLVVLVALVFLSSCAAKLNGLQAYQDLINREPIIDFKSYLPEETPLLKSNTDYKFSLKVEDPVLIYKADSLTRSNFKMLQFAPKPDSIYRISVYSLCDCLGIKKQLFVPQMRLTDIEGNSFKANLVAQKIDYPKKSKAKALSFMREYVLVDSLPETLRIYIYSDNSRPGQEVDKFSVNTLAGLFPLTIPFSLKSTTVGDFVIRVSAAPKLSPL
ncbi:hypothetical protein [Leeuwenhoekiella sp. W20_SRS_FM14]|uniref:hypothetical protein n=1 Tax=Leeuwenhoekiella sp. W20_SRS_FM14 TaxID=3240270 RepID=UPI003F94C9CF